MSQVSEIAKQEAERAEAEESDEDDAADTDDDDEAEGEDETQPAAQALVLTDIEVEKRYKAAGKRAETYLNAVTGILGDELMAGMVVSPLDALPGLVQVDRAGQVDPQVKAQTLAFLSVEAPPDYRQNSATVTCKRCQGEGDLLTGSKRKSNLLTQCPDCGGLGYTTPEGTRVGMTHPAAPVTLAAVPPNGASVVESHGTEDPVLAELRAKGYTILEPIRLP